MDKINPEMKASISTVPKKSAKFNMNLFSYLDF